MKLISYVKALVKKRMKIQRRKMNREYEKEVNRRKIRNRESEDGVFLLFPISKYKRYAGFLIKIRHREKESKRGMLMLTLRLK